MYSDICIEFIFLWKRSILHKIWLLWTQYHIFPIKYRYVHTPIFITIQYNSKLWRGCFHIFQEWNIQIKCLSSGEVQYRDHDTNTASITLHQEHITVVSDYYTTPKSIDVTLTNIAIMIQIFLPIYYLSHALLS